MTFKPGTILRNIHHGDLVRVLQVRPSLMIRHLVLTPYFYESMTNATTEEHYLRVSFLQWIKATWPFLKQKLQYRWCFHQPFFWWLLTTIKRAYF